MDFGIVIIRTTTLDNIEKSETKWQIAVKIIVLLCKILGKNSWHYIL